MIFRVSRLNIIRIVILAVLLLNSWLIADAAWRLPIGISDQYFSGLSALNVPGSEQLSGAGFPLNKTELILISLCSLLACYLSLVLSRGYRLSIILAAVASLSTVTALGHRYIPGPGQSSIAIAGVVPGPTIGVTNGSELKVYSAPNDSSQAIQIIPTSSPVVLNGKVNGWYKVTVSGGRVGWMAADRIIVP